MKMNETEIILSCLAGNADAFEPLVNIYQPRVVALAWNILGDPDEARDIAQETFIQAFTRLDTFDTQRNFKSWLLGITYKRAIDRTRRKKSFLKYFKHKTQTFTSKDLEAPQRPQTIQNSEIFAPLLVHLKEKERSALALQINENYSAKEIADTLDCSEANARMLVFRAKRKLKAILSEREELQ